ncbi:MucR family transcriptional regulator [Methylobacterium sp. NFXW15]|uniref:MucR family transcriptional regulator n=1 Tax=Methylobacterium sp. NFXW15 TaxID=2819512 RepID=UPI003CF3FB58
MTETFVAAGQTAILLTTEIVSAYVAKNPVPVSGVPDLIRSVHASLVGLAAPVPAEPAPELPTPAAIKKSVRPDALISFLDGRPYKTLKRHLTVNGMTPESYRARFGLPADYPMTAPSYSARRSELAKQLGLGVQHRQAAA